MSKHSMPINDVAIEDFVSQLNSLNTRAECLATEEIAQMRKRHARTIKQHSLRLRPSVGTFSLVSCSPYTPQLGESGLHSIEEIERALLRFAASSISAPQRLTPEKALQSWIIRSAQENAGELSFLGGGEGSRLFFVSDEVSLKNISDGTKIVADILAVSIDRHGSAHLVSIELKSERSTSTFDQVADFRTLLQLEALQPQWKKFATLMIGRSLRWRDPWATTGIVVWPRSRSDQQNERTRRFIAEQKTHGVATITYEEYVFALEQC